MEGAEMRLRLWAAWLVAAGLLGGCAATSGDRVGPFPPLAEGKNVTAEELGKMVELGDRTYALRRVAEMPGARLFVVHTTGELEAHMRKMHDQVFFVVSGTAISEVEGVRDVVGPGSVIAVPRGFKMRMVRGDADTGKLLVLVRVDIPKDDAQDYVEVKPAKPEQEEPSPSLPPPEPAGE